MKLFKRKPDQIEIGKYVSDLDTLTALRDKAAVRGNVLEAEAHTETIRIMNVVLQRLLEV